MNKSLVLGAVASLLATSALAATTTQLPRGVTPLHYDVALTPDAKAAKFGGVVKIDVQVDKATSSITLNAAGLEFKSAALTTRAKIAPFAAPRITVDKECCSVALPAAVTPMSNHCSIFGSSATLGAAKSQWANLSFEYWPVYAPP